MVTPTVLVSEQHLAALYEAHFGHTCDRIEPLAGDTSLRKYYRMSGNGQTVIGAYGPNIEENRAFIGFTRTFHENQLPVPQLFCVDDTHTYYILEDLGDTTLFSLLQRESGRLTPENKRYYENSVKYLAEFQQIGIKNIDFSLCYQTRVFGRSAWEYDLHYFLTACLDLLMPNCSYRTMVAHECSELLDLLEACPTQTFMYRDFQSRNIMISDKQVRMIDYQSGRIGHPAYDMASLLNDARADLPFEFRTHLIEKYLEVASKLGVIDPTEFRLAFPRYSVIRILQALGSYGNNGIKRGKVEKLASFSYAFRNLNVLLEVCPEFDHWNHLKMACRDMASGRAWEQYENS